ARVTGDFTATESGVYRFEVPPGSNATVAIDGAVVINGASGATSGVAALGAGSVMVSITGASGAPAPSLSVRAPNQTAPVVVFNGVSSSASLPNMMASAAESASPSTSMVENVSAPRTPSNVPQEQRRNLRSLLRDRVRERAIETAVQAGRIARATINGDVSDYVRVGETVAVTAAPPPGMEFVRWAGDVFSLENPNAASTSLTIGAGGSNVFAIYAPIGESSPGQPSQPSQPDNPSSPQPPQGGEDPAPNAPQPGAISVTINGGAGDGVFAPGARVVIRADEPLVGETFAGWTGDVSVLNDASAPVAILTVPESAVTVSATFEASAMSASLFSSSIVASARGATITGVVQAPREMIVSFDVFNNNGEMTASGETTSVHPESGAFAARIFDDMLPTEGAATVVMRGVSDTAGATSAVVNFRVTNDTDEVSQLVSRTTFGPTQQALARARQIGYEAYLEEQLNPLSIDDTAFRQLNPDNLFDFTQNHSERHLRRLALAYALYTERQLQEVLANFWENHFYTSPLKGNTVFAETQEKAGFRENALGRFRDLLEVSAKSANMMYYLDNTESASGRINENYARELLELHTVGVNSSYTEDDIIEVARILTGWRGRVTNPDRPNGVRGVHEFFFERERHDRGDKTVSFLNTTIEGIEGEAGIQEGEELLDLLAAHPDTASFICGKLVMLFVSDSPMPALTQRCAAEFLATGGEIRNVVRLILTSDEFRNTPATFHAKYKTPFEYVTSLVRAFDLTPRPGEFQDSMLRMANEFNDAGYDMYDFQAPTGLPEASGAWVGAASVVERV
ncbi:MAG: DUF1800 family protein, partial [Pseudomonadota bacterium]